MDTTENNQSALDAIDTVAFKVGLKGYNVDEVDAFLERLSVEVRQLKDLAQQQRQQLRQAAERISQLDARPAAPAPAPPAPLVSVPPTPVAKVNGSGGVEQVTSMIALAQRFIEHAQQEAEERARELTGAAQDRAREIVTEARSRAEDEVNRLNGLKQRLSEDVDTLGQQFQAEKARIAGVLAEFSKWVEESLHAGSRQPTLGLPTAPETPAASLAAPRPLETPPPAPAPAPTTVQPTIGQVLNFDQSARDDRP